MIDQDNLACRQRSFNCPKPTRQSQCSTYAVVTPGRLATAGCRVILRGQFALWRFGIEALCGTSSTRSALVHIHYGSKATVVHCAAECHEQDELN
jgi:hypothetical protein